MHRKLVVTLAVLCALLSATYAQQSSPEPAPPRHQRNAQSQTDTVPDASTVGMDEVIITLKGACQPNGGLQPAKDCVSSVTRGQFEAITHALQPDMPAGSKRNFANNYGKLLVFADVARALHLEDDPNVKLLLQFVTKQVLADGVRRHYTEEFAHPSDQQIQAYYDQNKAKYQEVTLERIIIPRAQGSDDKPKPSEAEWNAAAEKLRQEWVAGGDPAKLQHSAFEAAGIAAAGSPEIAVGAKRPGSLPAEQESVFQLKAGEVSPVYNDAAAGYVYKVVSTRQIPLSEEKEAIVKTLQKQELQDKLEEIGKSATAELNEQYFGPPPAPPAPGSAGHPGAVPPPPGHPPQ
jgi:hypothetical protein